MVLSDYDNFFPGGWNFLNFWSVQSVNKHKDLSSTKKNILLILFFKKLDLFSKKIVFFFWSNGPITYGFSIIN